MPVSYWPIIFPALLVVVPLFLLIKGKRHALYAAAVSVVMLSTLFLWVYVPGCYWGIRARTGDRIAMYEMARWTDCHSGQIGAFILWPYQSNVSGGYAWLEKSAALDYPAAVYALGVRLKYGIHVPEPPNWDGPGGNVFAQPERGQSLIDKARRLLYIPSVDEREFYGRQYRR